MQVKILILLSVFLASILYCWIGGSLFEMFGPARPDSFVGVMIALNTSIVFRRVRLWLFSNMYSFVENRANECYKRIHGKVADEKEMDALIQISTLVLNRLRRRLGKLTTYGVVACAIMAILSGSLYWVGMPKSAQQYLYVLGLPLIVYCMATIVCCGCARDVCREIFDEYELSVSRQKSKKETKADAVVRGKFEKAKKRFSEFTEDKKGEWS